MNRLAMLSIAVVFAPAILAQSPAVTPAQSQSLSMQLVAQPPMSVGCPISMRAQQTSGVDVLVTRDSKSQGEPHLDVPAQRIHLTMGNGSNLAGIVAATVTVRGTGNKPRSVPTVVTPAREGIFDRTKTLHLQFGREENQEAETDLILAGFTSVQSIRLDSLTYADGSIWTPSRSSVCRIAPDPLMLISGR